LQKYPLNRRVFPSSELDGEWNDLIGPFHVLRGAFQLPFSLCLGADRSHLATPLGHRAGVPPILRTSR
jgi:hypothetical protein